jgi:hypothetical protein
MLAKDLSCVTVFLFNNGQQQMLGRNKLVLHLVGLFLRGRKYLAQARAEILLTTLNTRKTSHRGLGVIKYYSDVSSELSEYWSNNTFRLFKHRDKQMLRLHLLVLVPFGKLDRGLNCFLPSQGELI